MFTKSIGTFADFPTVNLFTRDRQKKEMAEKP